MDPDGSHHDPESSQSSPCPRPAAELSLATPSSPSTSPQKSLGRLLPFRKSRSQEYGIANTAAASSKSTPSRSPRIFKRGRGIFGGKTAGSSSSVPDIPDHMGSSWLDNRPDESSSGPHSRPGQNSGSDPADEPDDKDSGRPHTAPDSMTFELEQSGPPGHPSDGADGTDPASSALPKLDDTGNALPVGSVDLDIEMHADDMYETDQPSNTSSQTEGHVPATATTTATTTSTAASTTAATSSSSSSSSSSSTPITNPPHPPDNLDVVDQPGGTVGTTEITVGQTGFAQAGQDNVVTENPPNQLPPHLMQPATPQVSLPDLLPSTTGSPELSSSGAGSHDLPMDSDGDATEGIQSGIQHAPLSYASFDEEEPEPVIIGDPLLVAAQETNAGEDVIMESTEDDHPPSQPPATASQAVAGDVHQPQQSSIDEPPPYEHSAPAPPVEEPPSVPTPSVPAAQQAGPTSTEPTVGGHGVVQWTQFYLSQAPDGQVAPYMPAPFLPTSHLPGQFLHFLGEAGAGTGAGTANVPGVSSASAPAVPPVMLMPTSPQPLFINPLLQAQSSNLHPTNQSLRQFLSNWSNKTQFGNQGQAESGRPYGPHDVGIRRQCLKRTTLVKYDDLNGDHCDMQGLDWSVIGVSRRKAREYRWSTFVNYVSLRDSDKWMPANYLRTGGMPPNTDSFFRFRKMHVKKLVHLAHFQLRNLVASTSRTHAFYPTNRTVVRKINMVDGTDSVAMRFDTPNSGAQISTIAADHDALVAGGFSGEYGILNLNSEYVDEPGTPHFKGRVTTSPSGISNHIEVHRMRNTAGPCAAFASNDLGLRILDLTTEKVLSTAIFDFPVNCTSISPDRRLRVVVGDSQNAYIIAADPGRTCIDADGHERPEVLQCLRGHRDFGFACAWADDGYTLATGNQDRAIKIWDARKWTDSSGHSTPVTTMRTEMASARGLRFSPLGSGKRVLVAAEEADFISIIDAQTFQSRQSFDIFGEIGGIAMTNDGHDLMALCADPTCGGILHFERCGEEIQAANFDQDYDPNPPDQRWRQATTLDWPYARGYTRRERQRTARKRLRSAAARNLMSPI